MAKSGHAMLMLHHVTGLWCRGPLKDLKDSKLILNESKLFP